MRSRADLVEWARGQWRRNWRTWLTDPDPAAKSWPLHPPTEAQLAADPDAVARWAASWRRLDVQGCAVEWVERRWPAYGRQSLPVRVSATPAAIAELAGRASEWRRGGTAVFRLQEQWPAADLAAALREAAPALTGLDDAATVRLVSVLHWLAAHPDSDLWERELPVPGVDTKWWERNRSLVEPLAAAITGDVSSRLRHDGVSFLVRLLDPDLATGPSQFSVDLAGLQQLALAARAVLVCENRTTVATLPPLPGVVAIHGMGFAAPTLCEVAWLTTTPLLYWGDLDTYGFSILGRVRQVFPEVRSVLMDVATLRDHAHLTVTEARPVRGEIGYLSAAELDALAEIRRGDRRLEQERIGRDHVQTTLAAALAALVPHAP